MRILDKAACAGANQQELTTCAKKVGRRKKGDFVRGTRIGEVGDRSP
jgi:hypothetical protein